MSSILLQLDSLTKSIGGKLLFSDVNLSIHNNERIAFMGPNGSGKSSLFKIIAKEWDYDSGQMHLSPQWKVSYLKQEFPMLNYKNLNEALEQQTEVPVWDLKKIAKGLGLDEAIYSKAFSELSGGFRMRFMLAFELAKQPDLILLDEPTNHLDLESVLFLEDFLKSYRKSFVLISHDREFLKNTCNTTMAIKSQKIDKLPLGIEEFFAKLSERELVKEREQKRLEQKRQSLQSFVDRFRAKASKAKQAQSRLRQLEALPTIDNESLDFIPKIPIPTALECGKRVLEANSKIIGYGNKKILENLDLAIFKGEKIGIVGKNGAGKSTLLKHLAGLLPDSEGQSPKYYKNCEPAYFAQHLGEQLKASDFLLDYLLKHGPSSTTEQEILDLAGALGFSQSDWKKPIGVLSGGEKMRILLAKILLQKSPLLLLDEPTNHLDFQTVEALAKSLKESDVSIVLVSHDRSFVSQICNKIIEVEDAQARLFPGTYQDYVWRKQELGEEHEEELELKDFVQEKDNSTNESRSSENFKEEKKRLRNLVREREKQIEKNELEQSTKQQNLESLNQKLTECSGAQAAEIAKEISVTHKSLELLEENWLQLSEEKEEYVRQLEKL